MTGRIHSFQSLGTLDGPGVRFVLFMQGCPLRCAFCHNPDTWDPGAGRNVSADEVFTRVLRCKSYFGQRGGLTVSGGEALAQPAFVGELFGLCRKAGIHTCLDTSGYRLDDAVRAVLDVTDLVLLDIKATTDADYRRWVGCPLAAPLAFLSELRRRRLPVWLRQVSIRGLTDGDDNLRRLASIARAGAARRVELLAFRKLCLEKYQAMRIPFPLADTPETSAETLCALAARLEEFRREAGPPCAE